jgi:pilus assembly protein TadC
MGGFFGAYAFFVIIAAISAVVATMTPRRLKYAIRESIITLMGDEVLVDAQKAIDAAHTKTDITLVQKRLLQLMGALPGLAIMLILLFFVDTWWKAVLPGILLSVLGLLWPAAMWKGEVNRQVAQGVYRDVPDLVSFLRLNVGEGRSLKEVLDAYVSDSRADAILAGELRHVLALTEGGANLFDVIEQTAARFPDNALLQVAIALRQVEEASEPQVVLESLYELIRAVRIAEGKKEIKARVMTSIVVGVFFLLPALFGLILVPALVTFANLWN